MISYAEAFVRIGGCESDHKRHTFNTMAFNNIHEYIVNIALPRIEERTFSFLIIIEFCSRMKFAGDLHACTVHAFVLLNKKEKLRNLQHSARADEPYEVYNILWICLQSMCRTRLNSLSNETTVTCENIVFTARIVAGTWYMAIGGGRDAVARKYVTKPFFLHTF